MLQKLSVIKCIDNTGAKELKIIGTLGASFRRYSRLGDRVKCSVVKANPSGQIGMHEKVTVVIVRTRKESRRRDGSYIRFDDNAGVIIDEKTGEPKGTAIFGPVARELRDKGYNKLVSLADEVL
jgi:large subunit ribosomal protein L14